MTPPSPNPTSMVRWEDSSSLEHSCWACPNKANSPKALHSCYGVHSMPCLAYHPTMHAIGAAHRCCACTSGREVHDNRHREIAQLLADYHAAGNTEDDRHHHDRALQERPLNLPIRQRGVNDLVAQASHEHTHQRTDTAEVSDDEDDADENLSIIDTASTATSLDDPNFLKLTKAEQRERKRAIKARRSQDKAAKNQAKHCVPVTSRDIQRVNVILHGDQAESELHTHPLATDQTIEDVIARNKGFVRQLQCHMRDLQQQVAQGRKEERERQRHKRQVSEGIIGDTERESTISAVLIKLGVHPMIVNDTAYTASTHHETRSPHHNAIKHKKLKSSTKQIAKQQHSNASASPLIGQGSKKATKSQTQIVCKLRDAIREDLEKHENDLKQTYVRAGAFFRYAGRQVFERMTEIASRIDVQTGEEWEKKLRRENHGATQAADPPDNDDDGDTTAA